MARNFAGMFGLGDNIYQRAFLSQFRDEVFLSTPWPELYKDLSNVFCVKPETKLRTQNKNINNSSYRWHRFCHQPVKKISYNRTGIMNGMKVSFGVNPGALSLPNFGDRKINEKYIVIRPVSVRSEWKAESRNPLPEYVNHAAIAARNAGFKVISVADFEDGKEWAVGELPYADIQFNKGELSTVDLLRLTQHASALIGGIGWIVPAGMAQKVKTLAICGGYGLFNHPSKLMFDGIYSVNFIHPNKMCLCSQMNHNCNKVIENAEDKINDFINSI